MNRAPREFFVEALDGTRLYTRYRPGPGAVTAVLCDGLCCDGFIYKYMWEDLAQWCSVAHFHYRGHGRSELPSDTSRIDVATHADDALRVVQELALERIVVFGHSLGTQVALELYERCPERVSALVLMCGSFGRVTHTFKGSALLANMLPDLIEWVTRHPKLARALWTRVPVGAALRVAGLLGDINVRAVRVEDVAPYFQHVLHVDFEMFLQMLRCAGEHTAESILPKIDVPTLVIAGEKDTITPADLSRAMASAIPGAQLFVVEGGTHVAPLEARESVHSAVHRFLNESAVLPS